MNNSQSTLKTFTNRLRVRACGVLIENKKILLVRHSGLGPLNTLWIPPGGGIEFGETIKQCIAREFKEETRLEITVDDFLFTHEHILTPLHAIELFHKVQYKQGRMALGDDPELPKSQQIIKEIKYLSKNDILSMDKKVLHPFILNKLILAML